MALADTGKAIGAVTKMLSNHLHAKTGLNITTGRPEPSNNGAPAERLNLFLYEVLFDPSLKNVPLDEGQPAPLWLVLKYLLTAFDDQGNSDSSEAHENLGEGIRALQELSFLPLLLSGLKALKDNPEVLKLTFDETFADLLSKIMQGSEEKYRISIGFQVRPVMIATSELPSYSLLVGVDYTALPPDFIGEEGIHIPLIPSLGPTLTEISPSKFEVFSTLTIFGNDLLNLSGLSVRLGSADLAITAQRPNMLQCVINGAIASGGMISAGSHPLSVMQTLPTGRRRSSNLLVVALLPTLTDVATDSLEPTVPTPENPIAKVFGNIVMTGILLGREEDDIFVALYKDGKTVRFFEGLDKLTLTPGQATLTLTISQADAVPLGKYRIILRVNGEQAKNSPEVQLVV